MKPVAVVAGDKRASTVGVTDQPPVGQLVKNQS